MNYHRVNNWLKVNCFLDTWTFWHALWGMIGARVGMELLSPANTVLAIIAAGIAWEIYELARYRMYGYSRWQLWANNTASDLFVETLAAVLVVM